MIKTPITPPQRVTIDDKRYDSFEVVTVTNAEARTCETTSYGFQITQELPSVTLYGPETRHIDGVLRAHIEATDKIEALYKK